MIKDILKQLNFSEKESQVYLALLEVGSAKPNDLAKKTDLNRTTIYDICNVLMQKGLISKYKKRGSTYFNALDPNRLINYLEREKEEKIKDIERQQKKVSEIMPQFISLQDIYSKTRPRVQFFEGEKWMREAYEDTLTSKEIILAYANPQTMHEGLPDFFPEYYKRRAESKIFIRAIAPKNEMSLERLGHNQEEMRDIRFLPEGSKSFSPEINIYNDKMLIASWKEKIAIIIESRELVELQKITFDILWNVLPNR